MELIEVMKELEKLGTAQTKKTYLNHGAHEPLFGVTTKDMKPFAKKIKKNHGLAMKLYATGNYDAAYLAGMIAEPAKMKMIDFENWIQSATCSMMSDYVVSVTLAETDFAQEVANCWIESNQDLVMSAGWCCYCWLLGTRPDSYFDLNQLKQLLQRVEKQIHTQPTNTRYSMNSFVIAVGISYLPLHTQAMDVANKIGKVEVNMGNTSCKVPCALEAIQKAIDKNRIGFKRRNVRC